MSKKGSLARASTEQPADISELNNLLKARLRLNDLTHAVPLPELLQKTLNESERLTGNRIVDGQRACADSQEGSRQTGINLSSRSLVWRTS